MNKTKLQIKELGEGMEVKEHKQELAELGIVDVVKINVDGVTGEDNGVKLIERLYSPLVNKIGKNEQIDPSKCIVNNSDYGRFHAHANIVDGISNWLDKGPVSDKKFDFEVPRGYMVMLDGFIINKNQEKQDKFIVRVELDGYREYEVEAPSKEKAEDVYLDNMLDGDKVKLVDEGFSEDEGFISEITPKGEHIHYKNQE